ncbi:protein FAM234A [Synchiropus picturatus]
MENADCPTEGDPLKRERDGVESGTVTGLRKKGVLALSKRTHWQTALFFLSLFLCLTIVFAFSFIIPCPVRPQYSVTWSRNFAGAAAAYDFLAIEDANKDKVMDVLFVIKGSEGSLNNTCGGAGLSSPCVFVVAVDGTDGETLWERPLNSELNWVQCGLGEDSGRSWDCLLSHSDQLSALDKQKGEVRWLQPHPVGVRSVAPVLSVPDLDGDSVGDIALLASDSVNAHLIFLSGKTGSQIGSSALLNSTQTANHLLHCPSKSSYYLLVQKDTGLYGLGLWRPAAEAGLKVKLGKDKHLEKMASISTGLVPVYLSDSVEKVVRTNQADDSSDLLLVTAQEVVMLSGKSLQPLWRFNITSVLSEPSFGYFNKDEIRDVVIEDDAGNGTKRVVIVDGKSGRVLWELNLLASPNSPPPACIHTTNTYSVFMIWGLFLAGRNSSVEMADHRRSYMMHPLHSQVLLESNNTADNIVAFKATLLERGRHAAYILLTGPATEGDKKSVDLSKRKLKQDVPESTVLPLGTSAVMESAEEIKEDFNRLRFSDH